MTGSFWCGFLCWTCVLFSGLQVGAQVRRVDLREWGYKSPEKPRQVFLAQLSSHMISIAENGDVLVGFVTHDRTGLVTREIPALSFHVLRFTSGGAFLSQKTFPTASWHENAVLAGIDGNVLIRTGDKLRLFSADFESLAERELPPTPKGVFLKWQIFPLGNRTAFVLYRDSSIELVDWRGLKTIKNCAFNPFESLHSAAQKNLLSFHGSPPSDPLLRRVEVDEICGPAQFSYSWVGDPVDATLVNDDDIFLAGGGSTVRYVVKGQVQWKDAFDKKNDSVSDQVEVDGDGQLVAIAVKRFAGGSEGLDIAPKLKAASMVVYQVSSGRRILETRVEPPRPSQFGFALSPKGDVLAIMSDGFLEIIPIKGHS
jgi:hypothetical protein